MTSSVPVVYRILSDHPHLIDWPASRYPFHRLYRNGQLWSTSAGPIAAALHPIFPDHLTAIRHTLERPAVMPLLARPGLTPADVMDLRLSVRSRIPDPTADVALAPCVRYNAAQDSYELHGNGNVLCWSHKGEVILALLRAERFEPGYIRRALDPAYTIEEAAASADDAERSRRDRAASEAQVRLQRREAEEAAGRQLRAALPQATIDALSLDDLLSNL